MPSSWRAPSPATTAPGWSCCTWRRRHRPLLPGRPSDTESLLREARDHLDRLEVRGADVRAERRLEEGDPTAEILRVAREIDASLIVLGTHGRTGLSRLLMGSVAEQVVRKAACPVLTVSAPFPGAPSAGDAPEEAAE